VLREGRFGPYVTDGETNASLRKGDVPESITLQRAIELLAERRASGPAPKRRAASGSAKRTKTASGTARKSSGTARKSSGSAGKKPSSPPGN
jgi:DNA topoisomerase I